MATDESALRTAFDRAANTIDAIAINNPVNAWMRNECRRELLALYPERSTLIEIGCGTGADAVFLAERGHRIAATDISDRMVERARERIAAADLGGRVLVFRGRLDQVASELERSEWSPFDGAYANFSLAYEDSLRGVARIVNRLVKPSGCFLFTVPNRLCISEPAVALFRLRIARLGDRLRDPIQAKIRGMTVAVRAYSPGQVRRSLRDLFRIEASLGLPVFMPPPALYRPSFEALRANLESFDNGLARRLPWRLLGDTTLFKTRKVGW